MVRHVCLGDTSLQKLLKLQEFMLEKGHETECFPDRIIFGSMFNITDWEQKGQKTCIAQAGEVDFQAARFRHGNLCFCGPRSDKTKTCNEVRTSHQFTDGELGQIRSQDVQ